MCKSSSTCKPVARNPGRTEEHGAPTRRGSLSLLRSKQATEHEQKVQPCLPPPPPCAAVTAATEASLPVSLSNSTKQSATRRSNGSRRSGGERQGCCWAPAPFGWRAAHCAAQRHSGGRAAATRVQSVLPDGMRGRERATCMRLSSRRQRRRRGVGRKSRRISCGERGPTPRRGGLGSTSGSPKPCWNSTNSTTERGQWRRTPCLPLPGMTIGGGEPPDERSAAAVLPFCCWVPARLLWFASLLLLLFVTRPGWGRAEDPLAAYSQLAGTC